MKKRESIKLPESVRTWPKTVKTAVDVEALLLALEIQERSVEAREADFRLRIKSMRTDVRGGAA